MIGQFFSVLFLAILRICGIISSVLLGSFIISKLGGLINWSWWWCVLPLVVVVVNLWRYFKGRGIDDYGKI